MNVIIIYFALTQNLSEVLEGAKHNGAYGKFYSTVTDFARLRGLSTSQPRVNAA